MLQNVSRVLESRLPGSKSEQIVIQVLTIVTTIIVIAMIIAIIIVISFNKYILFFTYSVIISLCL